MVAPVIFVPLSSHWYVGVVPPLVGVAVYVTLLPEHMAPVGFTAIIMLAATGVLTNIVIAFDVAGDPVAQLRLLVITQFITSPFASVVEEYVEAVAPEISIPLSSHWKVGVPPLAGVDVNVTLLPEHIPPEGFAVMLTFAVPLVVTDIVIVLDVAGEPVMQLALLVITQLITSPFASAADVYVDEVAPVIFVPFFFHW